MYIYHHHHVVLVAWIFLTLSRHFSLSFIASGRSSWLHPVSSHSCWMYVRAGRPAFARPCAGVHKSTSLMSSSLLLQQCPACLVRLTLIVFGIGGRWPYSWCLSGCCHQDWFKIARPSKVTHEPITRIISKQLDIKLGPFTQEELDSVLRKIKNRKAAGLDEIPQKYGRPDNSTTYCSDTATQSIIKIWWIDGWRDASSLP